MSKTCCCFVPDADEKEKQRVVHANCCSIWCTSPCAFWTLIVFVIFAMYAGVSAYGELAMFKSDFDDEVEKAVIKRFGIDPV